MSDATPVPAHGIGTKYTLALPQVLGTLIEAVFYGRAAKLGRSYFRFQPAEVWGAMKHQLPVLPIAALNSINTQGDYFIGSLFLTTASLGLYSFAYQIASQPYMVLTTALQRVLVPRSAASHGAAAGRPPLRVRKPCLTSHRACLVW